MVFLLFIPKPPEGTVKMIRAIIEAVLALLDGLGVDAHAAEVPSERTD